MVEKFSKKLESLTAAGRLRTLEPLDKEGAGYIIRDSKKILNLSSNDYLGLSSDRDLLAEFYHDYEIEDNVEKFRPGIASSRLLTGDSLLQHELENNIKNGLRKESALLFNSGYHANIGVLPALMRKGDVIFSDKLNHASIHDGIRLSYADCKRYNHLDYEQLEYLLKSKRDKYKNSIIVSESVFSMDGDCADLAKLVTLKEKYNCLLYIDDAHGLGLYGEKGLGKVEEAGCTKSVDLIVASFGKSFASTGAFVACSDILKSYMINHSRSLIFTTAMSPVIVNWNNFIFTKCESFNAKREYVKQLSKNLLDSLTNAGFSIQSSTNILPIILGDDEKILSVSEEMISKGFLLLPIRPPSVPEGTSRFRISVTADMKLSDINSMVHYLKQAVNQ